MNENISLIIPSNGSNFDACTSPWLRSRIKFSQSKRAVLFVLPRRAYEAELAGNLAQIVIYYYVRDPFLRLCLLGAVDFR